MRADRSGIMTSDHRRAYRQLGWNAASLFGAYALPRVLTIGAVVLAARVLGTEQFGQYATAAAFAVILSVVATLGMSPLLIREISCDPARARAWLTAAHAVKTGANLAMIALVYWLSAVVLSYPAPVVNAAVMLAVAYAIGAYAENFSAYFQAVERMHVWTQASAAYGLVTGLTGAVLVGTTQSVTVFCLAPIVGQLASLGWMAWRAGGLGRSRLSAPDVTALLRALRPFAGSFVVLTVYYKVDVLLLERLRDLTEVGVYSAAYKFVDVVHAVTLVAIGAVYPRLSRLARRESGSHPATTFAEAGWLVLVPIAGVAMILRHHLVGTAFGPAYAAAAAPLGLLAAALPFLAFSLLASYVLNAEGRVWRVAGAYGCALVTNVVLNVLLVPRFGVTGTAVAKLASEGVLAVAFTVALHGVVGPAVSRRVVVAVLPVGATVVMLSALGMTPLVSLAVLFVVVGLVYRRGRVGRSYWRRMADAAGSAMSTAAPEGAA